MIIRWNRAEALTMCAAIASGALGCFSHSSTTASTGTGGATSSASTSTSAGGAGGATSSSVGVGGSWSFASLNYQPESAFQEGITGVWFKSLTQGVVTLSQPDQSGGAGAVIAMTGPTMPGSVLVDGAMNAATMASGKNLNFQGLQPSSNGLVALSAADALVASADEGKTFSVVASGLPGGGSIIWEGQTAKGWLAADGTAEKLSATSSTTLSASTMWKAVSVACPAYLSVAAVYQSPDGNTIIVADSNTNPPTLCRSTNSGTSFSVVTLPNPPPQTMYGLQGPNLLVFNDAMHGIVAGAQKQDTGDTFADPWAYVTSDGGATWTNSTLPPGDGFTPLSNNTFGAAVYAPDGQHVWLAGSTLHTGYLTPLLYASSDGGHTFTDISMSLVAALGKGFTKVYDFDAFAGFALDANDLWLGGRIQAGGHQNFVLYSNMGGK